MHERTMLVTTKIKVVSDKPISDETMQEVSSEMTYEFWYKENGVKIIDTEITELEIK